MLDPVHAPRPMTPLSQEILVSALSEGFRAGQREVGYPLACASRQSTPTSTPRSSRTSRQSATARSHRLGEVAGARLVASLGGAGSRSGCPRFARPERLRTLDYGTLTDDELLAAFADCAVTCSSGGRFTACSFTYQAASAFEEFYRTTFNPTDQMEPYLLLNGFRTRNFDADHGLWQLSRTVRRDAALRTLFEHDDTIGQGHCARRG